MLRVPGDVVAIPVFTVLRAITDVEFITISLRDPRMRFRFDFVSACESVHLSNVVVLFWDGNIEHILNKYPI